MKLTRTYTTKNILDAKHDLFESFEGVYRDVLGSPEKSGVWTIYGKEKNGKTWGCLLLADYLAKFVKVLYISAEEGIRDSFKKAIKRAKIDVSNRNLHWLPYQPIEMLKERLRKRGAPRVVFMDNATVYNDELKGENNLLSLIEEFPNTLFIIISHEERNEPYTALGKLAKKLADVIIRAQGLTLIVSGRCPGGNIAVDVEKAALYHGQAA